MGGSINGGSRVHGWFTMDMSKWMIISGVPPFLETLIEYNFWMNKGVNSSCMRMP